MPPCDTMSAGTTKQHLERTRHLRFRIVHCLLAFSLPLGREHQAFDYVEELSSWTRGGHKVTSSKVIGNMPIRESNRPIFPEQTVCGCVDTWAILYCKARQYCINLTHSPCESLCLPAVFCWLLCIGSTRRSALRSACCQSTSWSHVPETSPVNRSLAGYYPSTARM